MELQEKNKYLTRDISQKEWIGEIISIDDPMKMLRVRCKIFGLFDDDELDQELIPWIFPANSASFSSAAGGTGNFDVPKVGTYVKIKFPNGDIYSGQYSGIPNINEKVRTEILSEEYENVHMLRYDEDEDLQIFYTPLQGIIMKLKDCTINVTKDQSVHIETKDHNIIHLNSNDEVDEYNNNRSGGREATLYIKCNKDVQVVTSGDAHLDCSNTATIKARRVEIGSDTAGEALVLGSTFKQIFEAHTHIGIFGIPTLSAKESGWICPVSGTAFTK